MTTPRINITWDDVRTLMQGDPLFAEKLKNVALLRECQALTRTVAENMMAGGKTEAETSAQKSHNGKIKHKKQKAAKKE